MPETKASSPGKTKWLLWVLGALGLWYVLKPKSVDLKAHTTYTLVYVGKLDTPENVLEDLLKGHILALYHWNAGTKAWEHWMQFTHFIPNDRYQINIDIDATLENFKHYVHVG